MKTFVIMTEDNKFLKKNGSHRIKYIPSEDSFQTYKTSRSAKKAMEDIQIQCISNNLCVEFVGFDFSKLKVCVIEISVLGEAL